MRGFDEGAQSMHGHVRQMATTYMIDDYYDLNECQLVSLERTGKHLLDILN